MTKQKNDSFYGEEHLMETSEVAVRMGVNRHFVHELIKFGLLPAISFTRKHKVSYLRFVEFLRRYEGMDLCIALRRAKEETTALPVDLNVMPEGQEGIS